MNYQPLKKTTFTQSPYSLVPLRKEDILAIKNWRNEQMTILRQSKPLDDEMQMKYYQEVIMPSFQEKQPQQILFSFLLRENCIGYGGLTHIDWISQRAEVSFLLDPVRIKDSNSYQNEFSVFLSLLKNVAFDDLKFNRLFTETFDLRPCHIETLGKNGFAFEGRLREHNKIENQFVDSLIHACLRSTYNADLE
jgi:RimJ/RimL family protein N-acetyltransferase